jgi:ABC-type multidrug transport system fused ATPase/permease subunit
MHPVSDTIQTVIPDVAKIGYTSQESFIMPGTLRDNILFGVPFEESHYNTTIEACALDVDFSIMSQGDLTRVNDGKSLSGGQKQRIVGFPSF